MATQVQQAINWAKRQIGSTKYSGLCQRFVADAYAYGAGMPKRSASSAKVARKLWRVSMSRSNIPTGAAVYFDSPTSPQFGHVGLYIGGGQVIHAFGRVKQMSIDAIIGGGYAWQGWGWNGGVKPSGAGMADGGGYGSGSGSSLETPPEKEAPIHIPQVERIFTKYENDTPYKGVDRYAVQWQSLDLGVTRDISDRVGDLTLKDDAESVCVEVSFSVLQASGEKFFPPLGIRPGDKVAVVNTSSRECLFSGQVEMVDGSYRDQMSVTCHDKGRLLTTNDVLMQFNNCPAITAISQIANRLGIQKFSCPNLVSSVYGIERTTAASIVQDILETVTAENGVPYFPRMMGDTLVIRSFAETPIRAWCRQEDNVQAFDVMAEPGAPQVSWDITGLRNAVIVYSEADDTVSVQAKAEDAASVRRYGRRTALVTYSDEDKVSAGAKAGSALRSKNIVEEGFSLTTYGSDRVCAGVRLQVELAEIRGDFWVTAVTHQLSRPHRMTMTLRRATL